MEDLNTKIGLKLKSARKSASFNQSTAAIKVGLTQDTISRLERGTTTISAEHLLKFSKLYCKPVTFFYLD